MSHCCRERGLLPDNGFLHNPTRRGFSDPLGNTGTSEPFKVLGVRTNDWNHFKNRALNVFQFGLKVLIIV